MSTMYAALPVCTKEEQHSVMRSFCGLKVYQGPKSIEDFQHNMGTVFFHNGVSTNGQQN